MDNYTQLVNKLLKENMDNATPHSDTSLRDQMEALFDEMFDAIDAKDKTAHEAVLKKYEDLRTQAIDKFGVNGPLHLIDPDLHGAYSDDFKDEHGFRPRDSSFRDAVEFYPSGEYGKIVDGRFIAPPIKSYIEDQEATSDGLQAILQKYPSEVQDLKNGGELDDKLFQELFEYYLDSGEMPYGVAKARTGDPMEWVHDKLEELGVLNDNEPAHPAEDNSNAITADDLKTLETVKALAGGEAQGGLFSNPEKQIRKAYGQMLGKVAKNMKNVAKKI